MCIHKRNLSNMAEVQLVKDYTSDHVTSDVKFCFNTISEWHHQNVLNHLRVSFESGDLYFLPWQIL